MQVLLMGPQCPAEGTLTRVEARRPGVEYYVEHHSGRLYMLTTAASEEYALMTTAVHQPQMRRVPLCMLVSEPGCHSLPRCPPSLVHHTVRRLSSWARGLQL